MSNLFQASYWCCCLWQASSVNVYYLHAHDTIDDIIWYVSKLWSSEGYLLNRSHDFQVIKRLHEKICPARWLTTFVCGHEMAGTLYRTNWRTLARSESILMWFGVLFIGCVVSCIIRKHHWPFPVMQLTCCNETCRCCLNLKALRASMYDLYTNYPQGSLSLKLLIFYSWVWNFLSLLFYVKKKIKTYSYLTLMIKVLRVFAPNGPQVAYLIPNIQQHQDIHLIWIVPLKYDLIVDGVTFNS